MKFLIVGLGNYDPEYENTRHNIGFKVIDFIGSETGSNIDPARLGDVGSFRMKGRQIYLLKPSTYMNRSGRAVHYWIKKLNIPAKNLLIVVDDIHLPFGSIRIRNSGSDGGHNGLKSIQEFMATTIYPRLRIGIGNGFSKGRQADFVLSEWSQEESKHLDELCNLSWKAIQTFMFRGMDPAMNEFNNKKIELSGS